MKKDKLVESFLAAALLFIIVAPFVHSIEALLLVIAIVVAGGAVVRIARLSTIAPVRVNVARSKHIAKPSSKVVAYKFPARIYPSVAIPDERGEYVYVLQDTSVTGYCKIGHTNDPERRLREFDVTLPFKHRYIHIITCRDRVATETLLHKRYASKRVQGEWFQLSNKDIQSLKSITKM